MPFTVSLRQMEEVEGGGTLEGCVGMAWGIGREARLLLGLQAAGKAPRCQLPSRRAAVSAESGGRSSDDYRGVEEGGVGKKWTLDGLHGHVILVRVCSPALGCCLPEPSKQGLWS